MRNKQFKQLKLIQKPKVIWFTGLSGSGKTTIAQATEQYLISKKIVIKVLDGDEIRSGLNKDLGFSLEDRKENIRRVAEVAKILKDSGITVLVSFISPTKEIREIARKIISKDDFIEVFVDASLETCIKRDVKGLYKKAIKGEIKDFTGIDSLYEAPENPNIILNTEKLSVNEAVQVLIEYLF